MVRITYGFLTRGHITPEAIAVAEQRAERLGVTVWVGAAGWSTGLGYRAQVETPERLDSRKGRTVEAAIHAALDCAEPWTADELVTVAAQSGLEVTRA